MVVGGAQETSGSGATASLANKFWGTDNTLHMGVIVDRTDFDGNDDLKDIPQVIDDEQRGTVSDSEGVVVKKNGKVRRKLRWKPPSLRRKKNQGNSKISSSSSVISSLTNKSSSSRSIFSHFSRRSQNSFHTFHSTETAKATNKERRPKAPHTVQRPNYQDSFENNHQQPSTIDNGGTRYIHTKKSSSPPSPPPPTTGLETVESPREFVRSATLPTNLDGNSSVNSFGSSSRASIESDPFEVLLDIDKPAQTTTTTKKNSKKNNKKYMRPPLFNRASRKSPAEEGSSQTTEASSSKSSNNSSSASAAAMIVNVGRNDTAPTISNSESPLDLEPSELPVLEMDDSCRQVFLGSSSRTEDGDGESSCDVGDVSSTHTPLSAALTPASPQLSPARTHSSSSRSNTPNLDSILQQSPSGSKTNNITISPRKAYNRPVDRMTMPTTDGNLITTNPDGGEIEAQMTSTSMSSSSSPSPKKRHTSIPVDVDDGAFVEAEHNLRAIHEMAAEHLAHDEYEEAIEVFEEVLRAQKERYGPSHYRVGTALHNLGVVHLKRQDYQKAISIFREAVDVRRQALVPDHPDVAISLAQLGVANLEAGNFEMALLPFRESLNIRKAYLGPQHPQCSKLLNNIGCALYSLNELDDARIVFEEALDIQRAMLRSLPSLEDAQQQEEDEDDQPLQQHQDAHEPLPQSNSILLSMASTLCNLGSIKLKKGQFEDASVALEEALLIQQSVLGDEHPMVKSTMDWITFVENSKEEAETVSSLIPNWFATEEEPQFMEDGMCRANPSWFTTAGSDSTNKEGGRGIFRSSPNMEEALGATILSKLSPKNWFKRVENVFTDNTCGEISTDSACGVPSKDNADAPVKDASSTSAADNAVPLEESEQGFSV